MRARWSARDQVKGQKAKDKGQVNIFNANTVLSVVTTVGSNYLKPTQIVAGRLFKFGAQVDF